MAAAVADFRPGGAGDGKISKDRPRRARRSSSSRTADVLAALAAPRAARARRSSASPPSTARARVDARASKLERKGLDAIVVNDISRADIGFDVGRERGHDRHRAAASSTVPRGPKAEIAAAMLDASRRCGAAAARARP